MHSVWRWLAGWTGGEYRYLAQLFRRLGVSLRAGVDIVRTLETEASRGGPAHQRAFAAICDRVKAGDPLWQAMESVENYFPPLVIQMVRVGEETGRLDAVLLRLADQYDHRFAVRREFLSALVWPMTELGIAIGVIGLLILITGWLGTTDIVGFGLTGSLGLAIYLAIVAAIAATIVLFLYSFRAGWWGSGPVRLAMQLPLVGQAIRTDALARFTWTLSAALDVGMDVRFAMRLALTNTLNPVFLQVIEESDRLIVAGNEIHATLNAVKVFPREMVDMVEAAEIAGTLSESLAHLARQYEEQARFATQVLARLVAFLVWLLVAVFIIALIFRLARVYFGAINEALEFRP